MNMLIVDDDVILGRAIARMLEALGHRCETASSVDAALRALASNRPDLLLTDYDLGGNCSGVDLAGWTRNAYDVPVVVMTGSHVGVVRGELDDAGLCDVPVLGKPFSLDALDRRLVANDNGRDGSPARADVAARRADSASPLACRLELGTATKSYS